MPSDATEPDLAAAPRERPGAGDTVSPLASLAELHSRIERLRAETDGLLERARRSVDGTVSAQDRDQAGRRVARLRQQLDAALDEVAGLRTAMETRGVIEQAKGIIMITLKVDADAAFDVLVRRSQRMHIKLVDVAREVIRAGLQGSVPTE